MTLLNLGNNSGQTWLLTRGNRGLSISPEYGSSPGTWDSAFCCSSSLPSAAENCNSHLVWPPWTVYIRHKTCHLTETNQPSGFTHASTHRFSKLNSTDLNDRLEGTRHHSRREPRRLERYRDTLARPREHRSRVRRCEEKQARPGMVSVMHTTGDPVQLLTKSRPPDLSPAHQLWVRDRSSRQSARHPEFPRTLRLRHGQRNP